MLFIWILDVLGFFAILVCLHQLIASSIHRTTQPEKLKYLYVSSRCFTAMGFCWWGSSLLREEWSFSWVFLVYGILGTLWGEKALSNIEELEKQQRFKPAPNKESQP